MCIKPPFIFGYILIMTPKFYYSVLIMYSEEKTITLKVWESMVNTGIKSSHSTLRFESLTLRKEKNKASEFPEQFLKTTRKESYLR